MELGAASQRLIPTDEQSGLRTRIATESVSLCVRMKRKFARLHGSEPVRVKPGGINSPAIPNRFVSGKIRSSARDSQVPLTVAVQSDKLSFQYFV